MKNLAYRLLAAVFGTLCLPASNLTFAQCGTGYTQATLNWTNIDFLPSSGTRYTTYYNATSFPYTQKFGLGTNAVTFTMTTGMTLSGENNTHTADAGTKVQFDNNGTITMVFEQPVTNVAFSIYDIDRRQIVTLNSKNAANADITTVISKRNTLSTILTLTPLSGSGTSPVATACTGTTCEVGNASNDGTIDVAVAGPVKTITITLSSNGTATSPEIYLSNIRACVTGTFPTGYYAVSRPFTGQAQYVITVLNNNVYFTDPVTGRARLLFTEPGHTNINSTAYDPYSRIVYYTYSLTSNDRNELKIKKYDVNTGVISTVINDVRTIGVSTYESGVTSGAAAFYNGSLYIGIEGYTGASYAAGRKSCVWKIDFDGSGNITGRAAQVYGSLSDNGTISTALHDWADFAINDGVLYDFNGAPSNSAVYHYNMMTGNVTNTYAVSSFVPGQVSVGWDGKIYQQYAYSVTSTAPYIAEYNLTGAIGTQYGITSNPMYTPAIPSLGDAAEAYRPFLDFGDAPASYDPVGVDPAVHDTSAATLRLGPGVNVEWLKRGVTSTEDQFDDGLLYVPILAPGNPNYFAQVRVFNNTGAPATLCGWLDYNNNGLFDPGEGRSFTVPSSSSMQNVWVYWVGFTISPTLTNGTTTYLRLRLTSAANGMTVNNPNGFFSDGEVEDYRVIVDNYPLAVSLFSFDAVAQSRNKVQLTWASAMEDDNFPGYEVQRSKNGTDWEVLGFVAPARTPGNHNYEWYDNAPYAGESRYRLRLGASSGTGKYSDTRTIRIGDDPASVVLAPNPAKDKAIITIATGRRSKQVEIRVMSMQGNLLFSQKHLLSAGTVPVELPIPSSWPAGTYLVQVISEEGVINKKLLINK